MLGVIICGFYTNIPEIGIRSCKKPISRTLSFRFNWDRMLIVNKEKIVFRNMINKNYLRILSIFN